MTDFVLVDLVLQRHALQQHVRGWSERDVLAWLRAKGTVVEIEISGGRRAYAFESRAGLQANFRFHDGELVVIGDHSTLP